MSKARSGAEHNNSRRNNRQQQQQQSAAAELKTKLIKQLAAGGWLAWYIRN